MVLIWIQLHSTERKNDHFYKGEFDNTAIKLCYTEDVYLLCGEIQASLLSVFAWKIAPKSTFEEQK